MTEYIVFEAHDVSGDWNQVATFNARSSRSAVRQYLEDSHDGQGGSFVAVPARSWKPVTVSVETKTTLKFE